MTAKIIRRIGSLKCGLLLTALLGWTLSAQRNRGDLREHLCFADSGYESTSYSWSADANR